MANGLPTPIDISAPSLGVSAFPSGQLALPDVSPFDVVAQEDDQRRPDIGSVGLPDIEQTPGLLQFESPQPPDIARPTFERPVFEPEEEFEPLPVSARADLGVGVSPEFEEQQFAVQSLSEQEDALAKRTQELTFRLGSEGDPRKRTNLEKEMQDNVRATQENQAALGTARGMRDRTQAVETARLGDAIASQQRRVSLDVEESNIAAEREQQLDDAERLRQQQSAESEVREKRERHAQIVERGPKRASFGRTAVAMFTEGIKGTLRPDGTADFGSVVDRLVGETEDQWKREVEAAKLRTQIAGDDVGNIARARKEEAVQASIIREMTARELRLETEKLIAGTQDEFARARGLTIVDDLKRQEAAEQAVQAQLAEESARKDALDRQKFRQGEAGIALTAAKIGTEEAKARGLAVKAARDAGRSRGSGSRKDIKRSGLFGKEIQSAVAAGELDEAGAKTVFLQGVIDPVSGKLTRRGDGSFALATSPEIAKELNKNGARVANVNSLVNQAVAIRGSVGWEPTSKWFASDAGKRMGSLSTELLLTNKDVFGLGILSDSDTVLLKKIQGGDLFGLQDPRPALLDMQRRMVAKFNQDRKSLAPGSQPLAFATVTDAPTRSIADLNTLIDQGPNLRTGDVPSSARKLAGVDEKFELLVEEAGGDIEKASRKFTRETRRSVARNKAHQDDLLDEFESAVPGNWDKLKRDAGKAALSVLLLGEDASGAEINRAEATKARTARAMENALSPRAKRLRDGIEENRQFLFDFEKKARGELRKQAEAKQVRGEEAAAREREVRLSKLPVSGKI